MKENNLIKIENRLFTNSLAAAYVLLFNFINGAIGIEKISYVSLFFLLMIFLYNLKFKYAIICRKEICIVIYILVVFLISFICTCNAYMIKYFLSFCAFGVIAMLIGMQQIDILLTVKVIQILGIVGILILCVRGFSQYNSSQLMGITYSMLPILLSAFILMFYQSHYRLVSITNLLLILYIYASVAPRGIWLIILIFGIGCVYLLLTRAKKKYVKIFKFMLVIMILVVSILIVKNLNQILLGLNNFLIDRYEVKIYALEKYARYLKHGNVLNGRSELWEKAFQCISRSPFIGNGIGYYESVSEGIYAHNIVLQAICEGGLFFLIPIVYIIVSGMLFLIINTHKYKDCMYRFILMTYVLGVIVLFFSSVYWIWIPFWFYLGFFMRGIKNTSKLYIEQKEKE